MAKSSSTIRAHRVLAVLLIATICTLAIATALLWDEVIDQARSFWHADQTRPPQTEMPQTEPAVRAWDEGLAPNYYEITGPAQVDLALTPEEIRYSPLDFYGRAGMVAACVTQSLVEQGSARERDDMSGLCPSGWGHNREADIELPDGRTYHGYFWNRSHLLAKSLGGSDEIENLICGTRMQNVGSNFDGFEGGMAYTESLVRTWLNDHPDGYVYYCATPIYAAREPVCRNVMVEVLSSDGELDCEVVVYNAAKGYAIDYATGEFHRR